MAGVVAVLWAVLGIALLFGSAVIRLGRRGIETIRLGLDPLDWVVLVALTLVFVYTEGILTFQKRWVPQLMTRVRGLRGERRAGLRLLAPLYALSLIGASVGRTLRAGAVIVAIVLAVRLVGSFPEPWRGIVDVAVAAALLWGLVAILWQARRVFR